MPDNELFHQVQKIVNEWYDLGITHEQYMFLCENSYKVYVTNLDLGLEVSSILLGYEGACIEKRREAV